jgi:site-specific DNA-methyltransferase (adenine-specific)
MNNLIVQADNLDFLKSLPDNYCRLIYIDPPFNTGKKQKRQRMTVVPDSNGDRVGFNGTVYATNKIESPTYEDSFDDFLGFIEPRLIEAKRVLTKDGSLFFHLDYREIHYCKVLLDKIFGRDSFINEIVWSYDYGAKSKKRWSAKHDTILWYAKDPNCYVFNYDQIDRIPYMAPKLVGPEKAAKGKIPTDSWFITIVPTNSKEKTGYPTQKPMKLLNRIIKVHSNPDDIVLDFFAGSGTTGMAAGGLGRKFIMVDQLADAIDTMELRLMKYEPVVMRENND